MMKLTILALFFLTGCHIIMVRGGGPKAECHCTAPEKPAPNLITPTPAIDRINKTRESNDQQSNHHQRECDHDHH